MINKFEARGTVWYKDHDKFMHKYKKTVQKLKMQGRKPYGAILYHDKEDNSYHFTIFLTKDEFDMVLECDSLVYKMNPDFDISMRTTIFDKNC